MKDVIEQIKKYLELLIIVSALAVILFIETTGGNAAEDIYVIAGFP